MARRSAKDNDEVETEASLDGELDILEIDQNLDDVPEPDLLPPGVYIAELQGVEVRDNQKGTGQYFAQKWIIPTDNFPADYDPENYPDGKVLYYNLLSVPKMGDRRALNNVRKFMEALGLSTATNKIDPNQWMGQRAKLKIIHDTWNDQKRESIANNGISRAK